MTTTSWTQTLTPPDLKKPIHRSEINATIYWMGEVRTVDLFQRLKVNALYQQQTGMVGSHLLTTRTFGLVPLRRPLATSAESLRR